MISRREKNKFTDDKMKILEKLDIELNRNIYMAKNAKSYSELEKIILSMIDIMQDTRNKIINIKEIK